MTPQLTDPIPNLFDKYGGMTVLKPVISDFCSRLLSTPSTRRVYGHSSVQDVIEHSVALFMLALGKPSENFSFVPMRHTFDSYKMTRHAYEGIVQMLRHVMLSAQFSSRDVCIAVNVLDIYSEDVFGMPSVRNVTTPFAGVDRRRVARTHAPGSCEHVKLK